MSNIAEIDAYRSTLFKATIKLAGATDTCYVLACDVEDAVAQMRKAYADLNVLFIESIERLTGTVFISPEAQGILREAFS